MFSITHIQKNKFEIIVLLDTMSGTSAEIIPSCGGILHAFSVFNNNKEFNVIDQYASREDFLNNVASKGFKSCKLSPFACRINNAEYMFDSTTYQVTKFKLGDNAIHGLIYDADFSIIQQYAGENSATLILQHQYRGADEGYPFYFDCTLTYLLKKNNELTLTTEITNRHTTAIPVQDGWHPYFTLGKKIDDLELELKSLEQVVFDSKMIPTREIVPYREFAKPTIISTTFFDDCFKLDFSQPQPLCVLRDLESNIQVEIRPDQSYPWLQLYTPPHRQSIAIENLSAPPDTFNNRINLIVLQPEDKAVFSTTYKITAF
jgi:aldose 1-epimerase